MSNDKGSMECNDGSGYTNYKAEEYSKCNMRQLLDKSCFAFFNFSRQMISLRPGLKCEMEGTHLFVFASNRSIEVDVLNSIVQ
jgi:hypothetical protein